MDSRARHPEPRGWLFAITAWTGFLGAALTLLLVVALLPDEASATLGWHEFSIAFLCVWGLSMLTITLALMLALPLAAKDCRPTAGRQSFADTRPEQRHGR